jgi:hypothetical protein
MNAWESVFSQSLVNDGGYAEDDLPQQNWQWPKGTWFQNRLDQMRSHEPVLKRKFQRKLNHVTNPQTMH